jgi:hypothetical protein
VLQAFCLALRSACTMVRDLVINGQVCEVSALQHACFRQPGSGCRPHLRLAPDWRWEALAVEGTAQELARKSLPYFCEPACLTKLKLQAWAVAPQALRYFLILPKQAF